MHKYIIGGFFFLSVFLSLFACTKKKEDKKTQIQKEKLSVIWYYFNKTADDEIEIKEISAISAVPETIFVPWTESCRVAGASLICGSPLFLINTAGVLKLTFPLNNLKITPNIFLKNRVSSGFFLIDSNIYIKVHNDSLFSYEIGSGKTACIFKYDIISNEISPFIFPHHFKLHSSAQLTGLSYHDGRWVAAFKFSEKKKVKFSYFSFNFFEDVLSGKYTEIDSASFLAAAKPVNIDKMELTSQNIAEKHIRELLVKKTGNGILADVLYHNEMCKVQFTAGEFEKDTANSEEVFIIIPDKKSNPDILSAALFSDGRLSIKHRTKEPLSNIELPKLPKGFVYTYFIIDKDFLAAAWEEQNFFNTGRTGLLLINLKSQNSSFSKI